jgi:hypothetical protein
LFVRDRLVFEARSVFEIGELTSGHSFSPLANGIGEWFFRRQDLNLRQPRASAAR